MRLRGAVCILGRFPALAGVDLDVAPGELLLLTGPNGAGKTTVLRLLAGLAPLSGGTAEVLGYDLARDRFGPRSAVSLLGHAPGCYDDLTVAENVRFLIRATGRSAVEGDIAGALAAFEVGRLADVVFRRLSAGQQRRVALAAAIARRPRLLLLDEPHAALDQDARDVLDACLRAAVGEGVTVIFSSHELDRARAVAQREVALVAGQVAPAGRVGSGPPNEGGTP